MKIAVVGLWHLGMVTAAALASEGHDVVAIDDAAIVRDIERGRLPVDEPGLSALVTEMRTAGRLTFSNGAHAASGAELAWICYDTPVDDRDRPDVDWVLKRALAFLADFAGEAVVAVSSQLPVGSVAAMERAAGSNRFRFVSIPENLRLGSALAYFRAPDRFVVGVRDASARSTIERALGSFAPHIVWMSVESAEMTKHTINAFLATSVAFANELAAVCERVGADAREVERGLKSDLRVGPKAYVRAGEAFAGGTLARDLAFLAALADRESLDIAQIRATIASNEHHRDWTSDRVDEALRGLRAPRVAILGLVYKPGTDTLRASTAVALARRLHERGVEVVAYDPAVPPDDPRLRDVARTLGSASDALLGADCAVVATAWPQFREIEPTLFEGMRGSIVIDPARFLEERLSGTSALHYVGFGRSPRMRDVS